MHSWLNAVFIALAIVDLTSCATTSRHQFAEPTSDWQTRRGQLLYRGPKMTLIGEVLVSSSKNGDFELMFSKGPGVTLLSLRQDATFARLEGALARGRWSGPVKQAPPQLRGWLQLRDKLIHVEDRQSLRYAAGRETFLFHF